MANRKRRCRECKDYFPTESGVVINGGFYCSMDHALEYANANKGKQITRAKNQKHKEKKEKVKTRAEWIRDAQTWFNRYIRLRDAGNPCISCQRHHTGQYHAGHYRSTGACPELRFEELNVNLQCAPCNNHLSGNLTQYRPNLIAKIGLDKVEWLEGKHDQKKYTVEQIKEIISKYKAKCRELESEL